MNRTYRSDSQIHHKVTGDSLLAVIVGPDQTSLTPIPLHWFPMTKYDSVNLHLDQSRNDHPPIMIRNGNTRTRLTVNPPSGSSACLVRSSDRIVTVEDTNLYLDSEA